MPLPYHIIPAKGKKVPILVSVPHCGTAFPPEIADHYVPELAASPDDTDFFVHQLYDFVTNMGITMIQAKYSRWVIDLNRSPENVSLYDDGRIITALTPTTNFLGEPIYKKEAYHPDKQEVERRKAAYFTPYYAKVTELLEELKEEFGQALLWDAHSIRQYVPSIQTEAFPDLILGNNDEKTAAPSLIKAALQGLSTSDYSLTHNTPFKGGNITRSFGQPSQNIHALQLEMIKPLYMDDSELHYHEKRAQSTQKMLQHTFDLLIEQLSQ